MYIYDAFSFVSKKGIEEPSSPEVKAQNLFMLLLRGGTWGLAHGDPGRRMKARPIWAQGDH